ncbi:MAG: YqaJ viral recombinase family protein [Rhodocyclaceae bacterium]|nr:YqaJ viral recombinase family protein [Rhodocyclaceae bacterium]
MNDLSQPINTGETGAGSDRTKYIGGSDVAAIMGVSPWRTPVQVWEDKTGRRTADARDVEQRSKAKLFSRGHRWEQPAFEMLVDELEARGHTVEAVATSQRYQDADLPFLACEIDREILLDGEHVNVEIKTVHAFASKKWGEMDTDEVPIEYAAQVMHGLGITKRRLCVVGCLIGADNLVPYFVERDDETIAAMRAKCTEFWTIHVEGDTPPDPLNFQDLSILFPIDNGLTKQATPEIQQKIAELARLKRILKSTGDEADELEFQIQAFMEPAAALMDGEKKLCTWKTQETKRFDQKAFSAEHPEQFEKYKRITMSRVFRLATK